LIVAMSLVSSVLKNGRLVLHTWIVLFVEGKSAINPVLYVKIQCMSGISLVRMSARIGLGVGKRKNMCFIAGVLCHMPEERHLLRIAI
jgi:hypothetical protein